MPEKPSINLSDLEGRIKKKIGEFGGSFGKSEIKPVAFGLNSLEIIFIMDESIGSTEKLEDNIKSIEGIQSVEVIDVRRAVG